MKGNKLYKMIINTVLITLETIVLNNHIINNMTRTDALITNKITRY
jgi:hypothetical protein